jgi:hypothetical protein
MCNFYFIYFIIERTHAHTRAQSKKKIGVSKILMSCAVTPLEHSRNPL